MFKILRKFLKFDWNFVEYFLKNFLNCVPPPRKIPATPMGSSDNDGAHEMVEVSLNLLDRIRFYTYGKTHLENMSQL